MTDRFDKFTERARRAMALAQQEALRLRHDGIGPEHLLLGLLREGEGVAARVLANLGADPGALRAAVEARMTPGEQAVRGSIDLSRDGKRAVERAVAEAMSLKHHYIGTEHLLLGLLREPDGVVDVLAEFFITPDLVRAEMVRILCAPGPGGRAGKVKRYNLALPEDMFRAVEQLAQQEHTTVLEVIRRSVKLGLLAADVQKTPGASLVIRQGETEREIILL